MKGKLLIFSGLPGSGKSTIAKLVAKKLGNTVRSATDTFRLSIASPTYTSAESAFVYESAIIFAGYALESGYNAILDGTFLRNDYRQDALMKLKDLCSRSVVVSVVCDIDVARQRNVSRQAVVPTENFERMLSTMEVPEGALSVDSTSMTPEQAADIIVNAVRRTAPRKSAVLDGIQG